MMENRQMRVKQTSSSRLVWDCRHKNDKRPMNLDFVLPVCHIYFVRWIGMETWESQLAYISALFPKHYFTESSIERSKQVSVPHYLPYNVYKPYVVDVQKNPLTKTIHLSTYNIGFQGQIRILALGKYLIQNWAIYSLSFVLGQICIE